MAIRRVMEGETLHLYDDEEKILSMQESQFNEHTIKIVLEGALTSLVVHDFLDELTALTYLGLDLVIDFEKVTYLSSGCTQVLIDIQQKMDAQSKGQLLLRKMPDSLMREMESTGASELLDVE
ncbi:MAG: STAS domain-containing protein [Firmicutes bacterium]|nr:STAS domain-containing protein [Bacillota bacterium]